MARISYEDVDKYGGSNSGGSFFKLEDDMDVAKVRLLGKDMNDFPGYACHEVKVDNGKVRKLVNCLRMSGDPVEVCPLCADKNKVIVKTFIPLYNIEEKEVQMWERGKSIFKSLSGYVARHKNVVQWVTEIERHGKAKDTDTTYQFYDDGKDEDVSLDDFKDDIPEVLGRYILDKTAEDMEYFLDNGEFPDEDEDEKPRKRNSRRDDDNDENEEPRRRNRSRRGDKEGF